MSQAFAAFFSAAISGLFSAAIQPSDVSIYRTPFGATIGVHGRGVCADDGVVRFTMLLFVWKEIVLQR